MKLSAAPRNWECIRCANRFNVSTRPPPSPFAPVSPCYKTTTVIVSARRVFSSTPLSDPRPASAYFRIELRAVEYRVAAELALAIDPPFFVETVGRAFCGRDISIFKHFSNCSWCQNNRFPAVIYTFHRKKRMP